MCWAVLATVAVARADEVDLPAAVEVHVVKAAEIELAKIERALKAQAGIDGAKVTNLTLPLQAYVEEALGKNPVTLHPRATYDAALAALRAGVARDALAAQLVKYQKSGFPAPPAEAAEPPRKLVASFIFDRERVTSPDPHLPEDYRQSHPHATLRGTYLICVKPDGKVASVSTVSSIPGVDQIIGEHIRNTWAYKPQPVPVCSQRTFVFQIN